ncbi:MAG: MBOAT family protein [Verrucomicrobiae bacterium]|nr:MBOAT family protein [Verrucomicrobiae bacterium]
MLFNTLDFWLFFAAVLLGCLALRPSWRNPLLLAASLFFYGCWDWRFVGLLLFTGLCDWILAQAIARDAPLGRGRRWVVLCLTINLGVLSVFKYFNFFIGSANALLERLGMSPLGAHMEVVLPVGVSFYTFQSISYIMDVYRGRIAPCRSLPDYMLFVCLFPQLVAGPIMRATILLPQVQRPRRIRWTSVYSGLSLAAWGLFKKMVIADNLAVIVEKHFSGVGDPGPGGIHAGVLAFAFQVYCDFSGYSDIARGTARALGFRLIRNFRFPYLAPSITDFWRRWHISLSTWLRDYLYIPLGGNRGGPWRTARNLFLTMLLGGLWHGAAWTYVLWGAFHGLLLALERPFRGRALHATLHEASSPAQKALWLGRVLLTFHLVGLGWIFFRCENIVGLGPMLMGYLSPLGWLGLHHAAELTALIAPLMIIEFLQYRFGREDLAALLPAPARAAAGLVAIYAFIIFARFESNAFIYFQF